MSKVIWGILVGVIMCVFFQAPSTVYAFSGGGSGTNVDPYQITTCAQLQSIKDDLNVHYLLVNDIDCDGFNFEPIGTISGPYFFGTLDGGGHVITDLTISSLMNAVAMIAVVRDGGEIKNIGIESGSITGTDSSRLVSFALL